MKKIGKLLITQAYTKLARNETKSIRNFQR